MVVNADPKRRGLLAAIERIRPVVEQASGDGESLMSLPESTVRALADAGLFAVKLPEAVGGAEADLLTQYEVVEAMAYADASAGWCLMIGASSIAIPGAFLADGAAEEVFAGGAIPLAATSTAPTGTATEANDGYVLRGRWIFASGVRHSEWLNVGALVRDERSDTPRRLLFALPTHKARILDNWDTIGLRSTGSCDLVLEDVFVPASFVCDIASGEPARGGPLYRLGLPAFVAYEHAAFAIGVARRAIDTIVELAPTKRRGSPPIDLADRPSFHRDLGQLDLRLQAARALVLECNREAWDVVSAGQRPDVRLQTELRSSATLATDVALDVVTQAYRYAGGSAVYKPNILERSVRDLYTATQHFMVSDSAYEAHGKVLLGLSDVSPMS